VSEPRFGIPAGAARLRRAAAALEAHGIATRIVAGPSAARTQALALIPDGAGVLSATSKTLEATGLLDEVEHSGRYRALRPEYLAMDKATQGDEIRRLRSAPDVVLGSVHAVTEDGSLVIASQTGSQLAPYAYGAARVIWVVGAQKVVRDLDEALRRVNEYCLPLEDARAREAYGAGSGVNKVLIVNHEARAGRAHLILIREAVGF
jgi:hypothetical protein